jgi:hypothetical protein
MTSRRADFPRSLFLHTFCMIVVPQWQPPARPTLLSVLVDNATVKADFPVSSNVQVLLKPNAVVDIMISGGAGGFLHPIHLHGHDFAVLSERRDETQVPSVVSHMCAFGTPCGATTRQPDNGTHPLCNWHLSISCRVIVARHHPSGRQGSGDAIHHRQSRVRSNGANARIASGWQ